MASRTQFFTQMPWSGGLNTTLEESLIPPTQLTVADNIEIGISGARKKRDGVNMDWDSGANSTAKLIRLHEAWIGATSKTLRVVSISDALNRFSYESDGTRTTLSNDSTTTAWTGTPARANMLTLNNLVILSTDTSTDVLHKWAGVGNSIFDLGNSKEVTSILCTSATGLDGDFFILYDDVGSVAFWYDVDNNGTAEPSHGADRSVEITTVVTGNSATQVATATAAAVDADSKFAATSSSETVTVTASAAGERFNGNAGTTTFTMTVTTEGREAPPRGFLLQEHLNRLWVNDKTNADRIHYSSTGDPEQFLGFGDSGALDVGVGDGDQTGITGIFPTFNGSLFIAKQRKLYRIDGFSPETFSVSKVSDHIGCINHASIVATDNDIFWVSTRGIHSLSVTANFGDVEKKFISNNIQKTFNDDFSFSRLKFVQGAYLPRLNSVAWTFTDDETFQLNFGATEPSIVNNNIYMYNIESGEWYRGFRAIPCESIVTVRDTDMDRYYIGTNNTRVIKTSNLSNDDLNFAGTTQAIPYEITTGRIFPTQTFVQQFGFKSVAPIFKPPGKFNLEAQVDNLPPQTFRYEEFGEADLLDVDFVLDQSALGTDSVLAAFPRQMDGFGKSVKISINQNETGEPVEIQGFQFEYEDAGIVKEVRT